MTTLQEEDDLFGSGLSADFYPSSAPSPAVRRPWKSGGAPRTNKDDRQREPYELLDDVPPAPSAAPGGNPFDEEGPPSPGNPFGEPERAPARYPVEELYPQTDGIGSSAYEESSYSRQRPARTLAAAAAKPYSPRPTSGGGRRYPMDDDEDGYESLNSKGSSKYGSINENRGRDMSIAESRSDSEMSGYRPSKDDYVRQESPEVDGRGCNGDNISSGDAGMATPGGASKASISSFDRLYEDEVVGVDSKDTEDKAADSYVSTAHSPGSQSQYSSGFAHEKSPGFLKTPAAYTPNSETSAEATPEEDPRWAQVKVDVKAPTPLRSNIRRCPPSPYWRCTDNPGQTDAESPKETPCESNDASYQSPTSPGMPTPPKVRRKGGDIFRSQGMDGPSTNKGAAAAYSFGSGIDSSPMDSSVGGSTIPSVESDDSAIKYLASFQQTKGKEPLDGEGDEDERIAPRKSPLSPYSPPDYYSPDSNQPDSPNSPLGSTFVHTPSPMAKQRRLGGAREDPPDDDFGYYPQNDDAMEPEGYRQRELFPDIDLTTGKAPVAPTSAVSGEGANIGSRYYEPECDYYDGYSNVGPKGEPAEETSFEFDDHYESMHGGEDSMDLEGGNPGGEVTNHYYGGDFDFDYEQGKVRDARGKDAAGLKSKDGHVVQEEDHETENVASADDMALDSGDDTSSSDTSTNIGDISVISDDTEIRAGDQRRTAPKRTKKAHKKKQSYYDIKQKDSMESDIKIGLVGNVNNKELPSDGSKQQSPYKDIKRNDSMEEDIGIDFEESNTKDVELSKQRATEEGSYVAPPPEIQRKPFSFDRVDEHDQSVAVSEASYSSSSDYDDKTDDESEASDDPTIFPSKAISRMNLGRHLERDDSNEEAEDLVERACHNLSRGRNDDALRALTEALASAQEEVDDCRQKMDEFYFHKNRFEVVDRRQQDEMEEQLDSDLSNAASEMADVLNNLGVIYELKGDYQRAMSAFRDALDAYRDLCHRYENAGDEDVDRTVSNILQMGIAMKSQARREDLHREAEDLAEETKRWLRSNDAGTCTQIRMERLNVLMCALDLEAESLGQNHPQVGYTLLKKGELHLEMGHHDMAIKDTRDAIEILKKGLGHIHPDVGLALKTLADIFNYEVGRFGGGYDENFDNKVTALSLYQESLRPLRESFGRVNPHLGLVHNSIGILYSARGESKRAMVSFYDALASYGVRSRTEGSAGGGLSRPDVFFVWINVGGLHMDKGEWQLGLRSFLKAQSKFLSLDDESRGYLQKIGERRLMPHALASSKEGSWTFDDNDALLAAVLQNIGKAHSMMHQYGKAIETLEEALRIHQVISLRGGDVSSSDSSTLSVARILENLGEIQYTSGDLTSAFERYVGSLDLLRRCHGDSSIEVALVLGAIGQVHLKKGEFAEAGVVLKECMRTFEEIGVPPNNRRINEIRSCLVDSELALMQTATSTLAGQRREISSVAYEDKALTIDEIGDAYRNKGDYSEALWFYSEALEIRRRRVGRLTGGRKDGEIVDVGRTVSNIAQLRSERREFGAAKILFDEAKQLYREAGLAVDHPFFRDLVQQIEAMRKM